MSKSPIPLLERPTLPAEFHPQLLRRIKGTKPNQLAYLKSMAVNTVTFGLGSAGTGKTFMAASFAAAEMAAGRAFRIVLSRPMVQCGGEKLGFLTGGVMEKVSPFMAPLLDAMECFFSKSDLDRLMELDRLRITPLELMRGNSYKDAIVIHDESQNMTKLQVEMALTRVDVGTKLIFTGDEKQNDLGTSPLVETVRMLSTPTMIDSIGVVRFTKEDCMRPAFVADVCDRLGL